MLRPYTCPRAKSDLERREPSGTSGQSADRSECDQTSIVLDAERVNRLHPARAECVQVPAVTAQRDIVQPTPDHCSRAVRVEETAGAVGRHANTRHRAWAVAGMA